MLLDAAYEAGITWLDTADAYGGGRSETYIGEWLRSRRARRACASRRRPSTRWPKARITGFAPERVRRQIDIEPGAARRRARRPLPRRTRGIADVPIAEHAGAFDELVRGREDRRVRR